MKTQQFSLIIFDADGTLTPQRDGACGPFSFELLPGVREKCAALREAWVELAIASNQSRDRSRRKIKEQLAWTAGAIGITPRLALHGIYQHTRKPKPIMINEIMIAVGVSANETLFVGDRKTDREAAEAAGCSFAWAKDFFDHSKGDDDG